MTDCPRTLAIYRPGVPMPGRKCFGSYAGAMPLTGRYRCTLCGQTLPEPGYITTNTEKLANP